MTGVTISWNLQVVQDSERTPETPGKTRRRSTPGTGVTHAPAPRTPSPRTPSPRTPRAPASTYFGTPRTTREVPRNSATTLSSQYKVTSVIPLRP